MLTLLDVTKPFEVQIDVLDFAFGVILLQENHPITYESHKLLEAKRRYMA